jgi:hypothetical protein
MPIVFLICLSVDPKSTVTSRVAFVIVENVVHPVAAVNNKTADVTAIVIVIVLLDMVSFLNL